MRLSIYRRWRTAGFRWEYHNHNGTVYLMVAWGSPTAHRWWATMIYLYLKGA